MSEPLDELYLKWLYSQVANVRFRNPTRTWWSLLRQLYTTEFVWLIPNDDNRVEDGRDLRHEFIEQKELDNVDPEWLRLGCSMLEMLIGLSRRLSFEDTGEPRGWFWHLLDNLDMRHFNDHEYETNGRAETTVRDAIDVVIWRMYGPRGHGGLFPLSGQHKDQREVELWYQMSAYLLEH